MMHPYFFGKKALAVNLLVFITNQVEAIDPILAEMLEKKLSGASVVDCAGMLKSLNESSVDAPPIFGSLRQFLNPDHEANKMLLMVLNKEDTAAARAIIHRHTRSIDQPNTGILFEIPVANVEGVSRR